MVRQKIWFSAQLLFRAEVEKLSSESDTDTYEESIILIQAIDKEEAHRIALDQGQAAEVRYANIYNKEVHWKFLKVVDLFELTEENIGSGTEVYSRFILTPSGTELKDILYRFYQEEI